MARTPDKTPLELDELVALAKRFVEAELYSEAVQLFEMALRLDPSNVAIQLSLAQVKRQASSPGKSRSPQDAFREQLRRDALDAKHFLGLAHLYADRREDDRAREYLEIAVAKDLPNPSPHKLYGRLLFRRREYARAIIQLTTSRRFNPFDREVHALLGRCRYELGDSEGALAAFIDAFLLLPESERREAAELKAKVRDLRESLEWSSDRLSHLFRQRQEALRIAFDRLEWHRERYHEERLSVEADTRPLKGTGRIVLAARLRELEPWSHLTDEQIFTLAGAVHEEERQKGELIFSHGSPGADLFVLEEGEITIRRSTPYGNFPLGILRPGDLFGEVNYITRAERSGDAVASQPCQLLRLDARELDDIVAENPTLGVQVFWSFWHGLAFKLRCTNEQLRTFFSDETLPENFLRLRDEGGAEILRTEVDSEAKMELLREQGLTSRELVALASFSEERTYPGDSFIFQEGDPGDEMFVVLEGKVRISKYIPGAGEEALAILERGGFFGEMALIDGQPRSADARAHGGSATVIALEEETIQDVLASDPETSLEFLQLLCRLVAKRLREIDEKVIGWRIMAGQSEAASA